MALHGHHLRIQGLAELSARMSSLLPPLTRSLGNIRRNLDQELPLIRAREDRLALNFAPLLSQLSAQRARLRTLGIEHTVEVRFPICFLCAYRSVFKRSLIRRKEP